MQCQEQQPCNCNRANCKSYFVVFMCLTARDRWWPWFKLCLTSRHLNRQPFFRLLRPCESGLTDGYLAGLFLFSPCHELKGRFFCARVHFVVDPELHSCPSLLELVVVAHHALCVDHHPPWHQPGTGAHSKVEPHLRLFNGKLVSLNRRRQVRLPYRVFYQDKELTLRFLCTPA